MQLVRFYTMIIEWVFLSLAPMMKDIFGGGPITATDPALGISRNRRKILSTVRQKENPFKGNEFEGVLVYRVSISPALTLS